MTTAELINPIVKAAITALQNGDRKAWSTLFEPDAKLYDDGSPRDLKTFTHEALGHERFTSIERVENNGLDLIGASTRTSGATFAPISNFSSRPQARSSASTSGRRHSARLFVENRPRYASTP